MGASWQSVAVGLAGLFLLAPADCGAAGEGGGASGPADVRAFGAVGDGRADDTEAIQRAVDSGSGDVRLPKGVYRITRPIVVDLNQRGYTSLHAAGVARIVMAGPGPAIRVVGTHFSSADPDRFADAVWERERMPLVDGLAISGAHPEACGIEAVGTMQLTITRVHIRGVLHGIHLVQNNRNIIISNCHIYHNRGVGVYYDDVNLHQSNIVGCHISYNGAGGVVSRKGNVRNIQISGCDLESNMSPDQPPTANVLIDCAGSRYGTAEVAITGCTIQHNHASPGSANIRILGASRRSEDAPPTREGLVSIVGNVLSDVFYNIHVKDCRGVVLSGNTVWRGYSHSLLVEDSSNVVIGPNLFGRRNPDMDYGDTNEANNALELRRCQDCTLSGVHVTHVWRAPAGIVLDRCRRINVTGCSILDCHNAGVLLKDCVNSRVTECLIRNDRRAAAPWKPVVVERGEGNVTATR